MNFQETKEQIAELVQHFDSQKASKKDWNEAETRGEFINPLFECLGWDVLNKKGLANNFKEVRHETSLKIGSNMKAPDYSFNHGRPLFYLEAKKPDINIKEDTEPAFQLRRYGWTAKMPISILTDFEELAIYDCRVKPDKNDKASTARIGYYSYREYLDLEKWEEIYKLISREAVLRGSLERFENKQIKGTASIDEDFLTAIEGWRYKLAINVASRNKNIDEKKLNFAIQKIIDRIIFLRIAEDRGIEPYEDLKRIIETKPIYPALMALFKKADDKYNSGLFHFNIEKGRTESPDNVTPNLNIDDHILKDIIKKGLYYPDSPYEFSVISSDILGSVYERFLGKVIELKEGATRAKVIDKPEVRKAGGVYYTPNYIVRYIVQNTIGDKVHGRNPSEVSKLKILDPTCGSGSFLIEAYQFLLDWHLDYYSKEKEKHQRGKSPKIFASKRGLQLTLAERKRILVCNIYGVDFDKNAVEVTKLSLLLKVLEYEGQETSQYSMLKERILPDLYENIKCGNSLINMDDVTDGYLSVGLTELDKINPFDWDGGFKAIIDNGGFDVVVGNPPYIQLQKFKGEQIQKLMATAGYETHHSMGDIYCLFYEKGQRLLKERGLLGFITSNKWQRAGYGKPLRDFLLKNTAIKQVVDFKGSKIFHDATVDAHIVIFEKQQVSKQKALGCVPTLGKMPADIELAKVIKKGFFKLPADEDLFLMISKQEKQIKEKIESVGVPLKDWDVDIYRGVLTGYNEAFIIDKAKRDELIKNDPKSAEIIKPILRGRDIKRYDAEFAEKYLIATHNGYKDSSGKNIPKINVKEYPAIKEHLSKYISHLRKRLDKGDTPYNLRHCAYYPDFEKEKVVFTKASKESSFALISDSMYLLQTGYILTGESLKLITAVLNSKLLKFLFNRFYQSGGIEGEITVQSVEIFPIPLPSPETEKKAGELVDRMLFLKKELKAATLDHDRKMIEGQIQSLDRRIDELVFGLYGLTEEEIGVVGGSGNDKKNLY